LWYISDLLVDPRRDNSDKILATQYAAMLDANPELTAPPEHQMHVRGRGFATAIAEYSGVQVLT